MQQMGQMAPQQAPMQQPKEVANMFKSEKEFLELGHHEWLLDDVEFRLLKKYQRIPEDQEGEMQDDEMVALPTLKKDL